jgi:hypothetical protein
MPIVKYGPELSINTTMAGDHVRRGSERQIFKVLPAPCRPRLPCRTGSRILDFQFATIDPMALLLGATYVRGVEWKHPHKPSVAEIEELIRSMAPEEREFALGKAQTLTS